LKHQQSYPASGAVIGYLEGYRWFIHRFPNNGNISLLDATVHTEHYAIENITEEPMAEMALKLQVSDERSDLL